MTIVRPCASTSPEGGGATAFGAGVDVGSGVSVGAGVGVSVGIGVGVRVGVSVWVGVEVTVGVFVADEPPTTPQPARARAPNVVQISSNLERREVRSTSGSIAMRSPAVSRRSDPQQKA
jgi:hypothetical protein